MQVGLASTHNVDISCLRAGAMPDSATPTAQEKENMVNKASLSNIEAIHKQPKRQGYLSWDDHFLAIAVLSSKRSKDRNSASGACIVDKRNRIVGT